MRNHSECQQLNQDVASNVWSDERPYQPTPETEPDAIARDQRRVLREAMKALPGASVAELSDAVDLPVDVIQRRLAELSGRGAWRSERVCTVG